MLDWDPLNSLQQLTYHHQLSSYGINVLAVIGTDSYARHVMTSSALTGVTTIGAVAGLGEHDVDVTPSGSKFILVVSFIFLDLACGRYRQVYTYSLLLDHLDPSITLLRVHFLDHYHDHSTLRSNFPGPMACSDKLRTGRVFRTLFCCIVHLVDISMLANLILLGQENIHGSLYQAASLLYRY